jgi:hypothetical protein
MEPIACGQGTYGEAEEQSACITCGSVNTAVTGYYCPYTKLSLTEIASNGYTNAASQETSCLRGHMCEAEGLEYPTPCPTGEYQD